MDAAALTALLEPNGWALLQQVPRYDPQHMMQLSTQLRKDGHEPLLIAAVLTQSRLRERARAKFGDFASDMLFTEAGLAQATRLSVAVTHASRFRRSGVPVVHDLGCGIGGDSMAMAGLDIPVRAVDLDEATAAVATVNLRHWQHAQVFQEDALGVDIADADGVFFDPARRTSSGKRVFDPTQCTPSWADVVDRCQRVAAAGVKTAPGIDHAHIPHGVEAQWVSVDGEVVEAGVWFGGAATEGVARSALLLSDRPDIAPLLISSGTALRTVVDQGPLQQYLYEPDGAIIRAGLMQHVANELGAHLVDPTIAYMTSEKAVQTRTAKCYQVTDVLPLHTKKLRSYCAAHQIGTLAIKKRGADVVPEALRKKLNLSGPNEATLIITRVDGQHRAIFTQPVTSPTG